jgi:hypothetical protein
MEIIPGPFKGMGLGGLGEAKGFGVGSDSDPKGGMDLAVFYLPAASHLPVPADSLQLASTTHAVSQANETLSKALVYHVTAAYTLRGCCYGRYKD